LLAVALCFAPIASTVQAQSAAATSVCKDGTTTSASGRGACSRHGGVDAQATKAAHETTHSANSNAQVSCSDGTTSKSGRGACSHHGGVATSATTALPAPTRAQTPVRSQSQVPASAPRATTSRSGASEDNNPTGSIAQCKDGLYSHARHRQGACSRHGGVAKWTTS
jgi:hypothetical protein